ncbi:hypothetical protein GHT09_004011 [Marmota monax]|uniref:G-protein coupled receptors family 1 profile domain-containing protein n=1 Tax=Marmota monax TaxID=9995 RepID=A0A834PS13_MARMO|nr:hypothetical protein GHT09_004011 [Marmota monax]
MYLVTVLGNLLIILAINSDSPLHTPMYLFLSNLSLADIGFISTTVPNMIVGIQTHSRVTSYVGCLTQMSFFLIFGYMDDMLLTVMAYDRFVAICHPLHYQVIMNPPLFVGLFYGPTIGVYLASAVSDSPRKFAVFSVMYTVVTPMLNPFIYSLRNKDIKTVLMKLQSRPF